MTTYVLDTDVLSLLARRDTPEAPRVRRRIADLPDGDVVATSIITYEEQMRGWMALLSRTKSPQAEVAVYERLLDHLATFRRIPVLGYDAAAATIVQDLRKRRIRIGTMDAKIAAIVLARGAVLVTRNTADFRVVLDLRIEDWTTEH